MADAPLLLPCLKAWRSLCRIRETLARVCFSAVKVPRIISISLKAIQISKASQIIAIFVTVVCSAV